MPHGWTGDAQSRLKQNAFPIRGCQGVGSAEHRGYLGGLMVNIPAKPCHDLLYISGDFRRLYPVGTNAKSMSCWVGNASRAARLNGWGR
jgi:hypothetical protein